MSKQQVKLSFDGSVRKVMMDVGSYELIQQSVSNVIGLPVGEFTVSYVDDDKDVISFPRTGVTKDEFDAFRSVEGPIRLIIERVVKANQTSTTVKDDVTAPSSASSSTAASTSAAVEEEEEEPPKKEKSLCSLIGTILSNENIVHDVQSAIASKQVADIAALIGATLVAAGNNEQGCGFPSLLPILFTQAPVLLDILHQLSEKHPEIKELVETVKEQGFSSFVHPRMYRKFFKICKRGGFGCHNEEQSDDNVEHHHHPHPHPPGHHHHHPDHHHGGHHHHHPDHHHGGHHHHHPDHPPFHPHHHHPGHHGHHWPPHHHHGHHPDHPPFHPPHHHHHPGHHHHHGGPDGDGFGRKSIHYGVTCDGCSSNNELKGKSLRDGHFAHHRGGFIAGNRYKSTSVHNFDLCESCEGSGLFQQTHGPFIKIPNRVHGGWRRWSPFEQFERNVETTATSASSSSNSDEDDEVEQMYAQGASSSFEQKKNKGNEFDDIQKQGMDLFSSIMKAVSESSQPKKQNPDKDIDALAEKWKSKIELLQSLGFVEWKRYLPILEEENGDLERCIGRILALNDA